MLLSRLLLLPVAVASSVTLYVSSVPASADTAAIASPVPLAQIEYDADQSVGTLASYTPPSGSYSADHLLRVGLTDPKSGSWRGVVTSAASFSEQYNKKFVIHVDDKGEPFHIGFGTKAKGSGDEVEVEVVRKNVGPKPVLNKPIVLNAEGKLGGEEPEKTFLQKWVETHGLLEVTILTKMQVLVGSGTLPGCSTSRRWWWWWWWREISKRLAGCLRRYPSERNGYPESELVIPLPTLISLSCNMSLFVSTVYFSTRFHHPRSKRGAVLVLKVRVVSYYTFHVVSMVLSLSIVSGIILHHVGVLKQKLWQQMLGGAGPAQGQQSWPRKTEWE